MSINLPMSHNTPEQNAAFREAWDATNARWKAGENAAKAAAAGQMMPLQNVGSETALDSETTEQNRPLKRKMVP